jgi:hypothetical protein
MPGEDRDGFVMMGSNTLLKLFLASAGNFAANLSQFRNTESDSFLALRLGKAPSHLEERDEWPFFCLILK